MFAGDHINSESARVLRNWVADGGILISVAGGGFLSEYNEPSQILNEVYGIEEFVLKKRTNRLRVKLELIHANPFDKIIFTKDGIDYILPVLGYKQTFKVKGGKVIGTYLNGEPAIVMNNYGKGKALIVGALPGHAYFYKAFPLKPYGRGEKIYLP